MKTRRTFAIAALALGALTACSSGPSETAVTATASASQVAVDPAGSATDVAFAQSMIPHHEQALEMADLALSGDSGASQQVRQLAERIKSAQDPEIQQMTAWLQDWGAPTAMPGASDRGVAGMDHSGHDMGDMTVSGMMAAEQMQQLRQVSGRQFDRMWLSMMIAHHEGAIAMAEQAQSSGNGQVKAMSVGIAAAQQEEISAMQELLAGGR
ncbi:MAG: DUF305 domain-containing protein [Candidatus Nanopelagicales bacterium]